MLALPEHGAPDRADPSRIDPTLRKVRWGSNEIALGAPVGLLSWLIRNLELPEGGIPDDGRAVRRRRRLAERDPRTVERALAALRTRGTRRAWHILEDKSRPDVYLETRDALVVIEGKRKEAGPTTSTKWMPVRHQMIRHLDAAWEIRADRAVFGFFIVEAKRGDEVPEHWVQAARATFSDEALEGSLPHRSWAEAAAIARAFLGVTTWQRVCRELQVDPGVLIDRIE